MLFQNENVQELLNGLIKIGEVSSINPTQGTARVLFDDDDSIVSFDLQVLQRNTFKNRDYAMPDVGEDVLCLFLPTGTEEGFILGSVYAGEVSPKESTGDIRSVVFADGTRIAYDRSAGELTIEIKGTKIVANGQNVNIAAPTVIDLKAPTITLTMGGTTMVLSGSQASIKASNLVFEGDMSVTGNLSVTGNVSASGSVHGTNI
ncbi:MAG: phage baseplate assembly protein V [Burkholderiaceae bacterium]|nr:phage baseplate assembly protein V [Burkholderiaceae bacterium]